MGASLFSMFIALTGFPMRVAEFMVGLEIPRIATLVFILIPYIPLGMFIDSISMILLTIPIFHPVVLQLGFSPIWFGVLIIKLVEIALLTPPVGGNLYVIKGIAPDTSFTAIVRGCLWFIVTDLVTLALLIGFPQISLLIPNMMK
ncbi:TRAP transporter large permease subunit [Chloroflexota bacterium]